ncbi:MAG: hypothetical protein KDB84_02720 [Flavobacteriales bacterium]|nr:hypothetical protein [Flavobacteriales bacterium]
MFTQALFALALIGAPMVPTGAIPMHVEPIALPGGPPAVRLADRPNGDIGKVEWMATERVELYGCVPDARITAMRICIRDCNGKDAAVHNTNGSITKAMRTMVLSLPPGTPFTVKVTVRDGTGKAWAVPEATYVWKG